jgi:oxygen-independent coproporphyrinogen-3 oxidase
MTDRSLLVERAIRIGESLNLPDIRRAGLLRDRAKYFLNISYPSLQAMEPVRAEQILASPAPPNGRRVALYVHIPFCSALCTYCHYYKLIAPSPQTVERYLAALEGELALYRRLLGDIKTASVYVGGGTPSFLSVQQIRRLFMALRAATSWEPGAEITFEIHPENATAELFDSLAACGVNRISIGVETFDDESLKNESRRHTAAQAIAAFRTARWTFDNVNIDLIYGLFGQNPNIWERNLSVVSDLGPPSICAYYLRLKAGTLDLRRAREQPEAYPSETDLLTMHIMTVESLTDRGYSQPIVDWFVADDKYYHRYQEHNWQALDDVELLGVGASAYSYLNGYQYYNVNDIAKYMHVVESGEMPFWRGEHLDSVDEQMRRTLMLGLKAGIDRARFSKQHGVDVVEAFPDEWTRLAALGLVTIAPDSVALSYSGRLFADEIGQLFYSPQMRRRMESIDPLRISTTLPRLNVTM